MVHEKSDLQGVESPQNKKTLREKGNKIVQL